MQKYNNLHKTSILNDNFYMQRCLDLAKQGFGNTYPNPMVGCVIVHNNAIIGEGFHKKAGEAHAEVNAINSILDTSVLPYCTLYVNLEPCSHWGKTPPCADLIVKHKFKRVVIGCIDTFSQVAGRGVERLRSAGIDVTVGILEKESRDLNIRFFTFHEKKRPYIILKWAQTQDAFIDIAPELKSQTKGMWITDETCKKMVHEWRTQEPAILVGTNTALNDNPMLTARLANGNNPLRIAIDLQNRLPSNLNIKDGTSPSVIYTYKEIESSHNLEFCTLQKSENIWNEIFKDLYAREVQSIIIEGGAAILNNCILHNLWDEMRVFIGPAEFKKGIKAPHILQKYSTETTIGNSKLRYYWNTEL